jgi:hypothetical protein
MNILEINPERLIIVLTHNGLNAQPHKNKNMKKTTKDLFSYLISPLKAAGLNLIYNPKVVFRSIVNSDRVNVAKLGQ